MIPLLLEMQELSEFLKCEFVLAADGREAFKRLSAEPTLRSSLIQVRSRGYIESVHDDVLQQTSGKYVLRLDDDERCSRAMVSWLYDKGYESRLHWKFARAALWGTASTFIVSPHLWPDHQTRLSRREFAKGRRSIHAGSPYGGGEEAPVVLEHHKFLLKSYAQRQEIAQRYERIAPGAGSGHMLAFQLPEDAYGGVFNLAKLSGGVLAEIDVEKVTQCVVR